MSNIHELKPNPGARTSKKRIGRGVGSGSGKTSGRGHNGQMSRTGATKRAWFEGGQMPLQRRVPKRGFTPPFRKEYQVVNLSCLSKFEAGTEVTIEKLNEHGLVRDKDGLVKILGNGELETEGLEIKAHGFSKSAKEKIEAKGGKATVIEG